MVPTAHFPSSLESSADSGLEESSSQGTWGTCPGIHDRSSWDGHCGNNSLGKANPGLLTTDEPQDQRAIKALLWVRNTSMSPPSLSKYSQTSLCSPSFPSHQTSIILSPILPNNVNSMFYANCSCHTMQMTEVSTLLLDRVLNPLCDMWWGSF